MFSFTFIWCLKPAAALPFDHLRQISLLILPELHKLCNFYPVQRWFPTSWVLLDLTLSGLQYLTWVARHSYSLTFYFVYFLFWKNARNTTFQENFPAPSSSFLDIIPASFLNNKIKAWTHRTLQLCSDTRKANSKSRISSCNKILMSHTQFISGAIFLLPTQ